MFNISVVSQSYAIQLLKYGLIALLLNLTDATLLNSHNFSQAQTQQNYQTEADQLQELARKYYQNNQIQQALLTLQQELKLRRQMGDTIKEISTLNFIGLLYDKQGKYPQAMEYLQLALTTLKKANTSADIQPNIIVSEIIEGEILVGIGFVYANQGKYDKALEIARQIKLITNKRIQSLATENTTPNNISGITQSVSDIKADADTLYNIAISQAQQGKIREALATAEVVLKMHLTAQDKTGEREVSSFINSLRQRLF